VALGDYNAFEFNDGLTDAMNVVIGTPSPDNETAVGGDGIDLVNPDLVNLGAFEQIGQHYSFVFDGNAQTLDHVLANETMLADVAGFGIDHARINADFPETDRTDANSPRRLSDHDPVVTYFEVLNADLAVTVNAVTTPVIAGDTLSYTATVSNAGPNRAEQAAVGFALNAALPTMAVTAPAGWTCDAPVVNAGMTSIACLTASMANGANANFAITATSLAAQAGTQATLAAAVTTQSVDLSSGNNQAVASINVVPPPQVDLALQFAGPASVPAGTFSIQYTATLNNLGTLAAQQPQVVFSGNTMTSTAIITKPAGWNCTRQGTVRASTFSCTSATPLAGGASASFGVKVNATPVPSNRVVRVEGAATTTSAEVNTLNNNATIGTTVP
jgi:uncharacterized repeat protein (TIGR01451 family)